LNGPTALSLQDERAAVFSAERRILNPNGYDNPYTHQFALGYQRQLDNRRLFYVDLVHNRSENLYRLRNLNAAAPYPITDPNNVVVRSVAEADLTRPVPIINGTGIINGQPIAGVARNVVLTEAAGQSRYYAASVVLQQDQGEENFGWRLNYTLSSLENNTEDINFRAQDGNNFSAEWGPSINDRRHIINAIVTYSTPFGLNLTLASLLQSGQPINRIPDATLYGTADLNGDGSSFGDAYVGNSDRYPGAARNSDRLPWSYNFDLSLQYLLSVGANNLEFRADVFNLLDTRNLSGYSNNATSSNQIQVGPSGIVQRNADAPRQAQIGLRYLF
ncbi:MAG: TonB-dependent receptor, partial [Saprospiraceae bacterium]|nr:TonB-dependent receptor [Saprospiraceae bacterium]